MAYTLTISSFFEGGGKSENKEAKRIWGVSPPVDGSHTVCMCFGVGGGGGRVK